MTYKPEKHHRRSIRLKEHDYTNPGAYFITICSWQGECIFGNIIEGEMRLNECGEIAKTHSMEIPDHFSFVALDYMVVMPNHVHLILNINDHCRGTACRAPTVEQFGSPVHGSVPTIIRSYKSSVTKQINKIRNTPGVPVWQRNYFERVIRNEKELFAIGKYIVMNPLQWKIDEENPENMQEIIDDV